MQNAKKSTKENRPKMRHVWIAGFFCYLLGVRIRLQRVIGPGISDPPGAQFLPLLQLIISMLRVCCIFAVVSATVHVAAEQIDPPVAKTLRGSFAAPSSLASYGTANVHVLASCTALANCLAKACTFPRKT